MIIIIKHYVFTFNHFFLIRKHEPANNSVILQFSVSNSNKSRFDSKIFSIKHTLVCRPTVETRSLHHFKEIIRIVLTLTQDFALTQYSS